MDDILLTRAKEAIAESHYLTSQFQALRLELHKSIAEARHRLEEYRQERKSLERNI